MMPSGHKAFVVSNVKDVELLLMHNKIYAAEYVLPCYRPEIHTRLRSTRGREDGFGRACHLRRARS